MSDLYKVDEKTQETVVISSVEREGDELVVKVSPQISTESEYSHITNINNISENNGEYELRFDLNNGEDYSGLEVGRVIIVTREYGIIDREGEEYAYTRITVEIDSNTEMTMVNEKKIPELVFDEEGKLVTQDQENGTGAIESDGIVENNSFSGSMDGCGSGKATEQEYISTTVDDVLNASYQPTKEEEYICGNVDEALNTSYQPTEEGADNSKEVEPSEGANQSEVVGSSEGANQSEGAESSEGTSQDNDQEEVLEPW